MYICKSEALILVPQWKNAYFYPILEGLRRTGNVVDVKVFSGENIFRHGADIRSYFGPNFEGFVEVWYISFRC
jgi:hypothetical protein